MATKLLKDYELNEEVVTDTQIIAALGYTPENVANKKTDLSADSDTYIPSQSAVNDALALKADASALANYVKTDGTSNIQYSTGSQKIGNVSGGNYLDIEADGTIEFVGDAVVWDDLRVTPGSFDRPGSSDPVIVSVQPGGSGTATWLYEFAKNNIASFTVQLPHGYKVGSDIKAHIHWTPGARGNEENGSTVGWKIDYTWASINGAFGSMATLDLSDACNGVDWEHNMTPNITITGTDKGISSMLICNVKRTDTGTDDTWAGTASGSLPMLLEIDFHYQIDTVGSRDTASK